MINLDDLRKQIVEGEEVSIIPPQSLDSSIEVGLIQGGEEDDNTESSK